jgi:hypothetical protein
MVEPVLDLTVWMPNQDIMVYPLDIGRACIQMGANMTCNLKTRLFVGHWMVMGTIEFCSSKICFWMISVIEWLVFKWKVALILSPPHTEIWTAVPLYKQIASLPAWPCRNLKCVQKFCLVETFVSAFGVNFCQFLICALSNKHLCLHDI